MQFDVSYKLITSKDGGPDLIGVVDISNNILYIDNTHVEINKTRRSLYD